MPIAVPERARYPGEIILVALLYVLAGRAGLALDAVSGFATLVWAPTGIALAALLLGGYRLWPAAFIGAFAVNILTGATPFVALGIATGNTLEALAGTWAVRLIPGFRASLDRLVDVLALILLGAILSTMLSASIGVLSLYFGGVLAPGAGEETWRAWWIGDAIGALLIAPLILVWAGSSRGAASARRSFEAIVLALAVLTTALLIFLLSTPGYRNPANQSYVFFPLLIWAAIRFGKRGAVSAVFLVSVLAIWGTANSRGPFVHVSLHESLYALQAFIGVTAATFLVLGASVSERRRTETELRLAHGIATEANRAKAEFLAVMSHELRTPLNAISGYAELLSLGLAGPLSEKQTEAVARIQMSQQHLLGLIDDVLSFAKMEAGRSEVVTQPVALCAVLDSLEQLLQPELLHKTLSYTRERCDPALMVLADPPKLRQVLLNILGNAIKFTAEGGEIHLSANRDSDNVVINVADTGIGIPADKLEQIFEPFYQVESGTTRRYEGVGLGLAISRDLARSMGGDIRLASEIGKGTVVSVVVPAAR